MPDNTLISSDPAILDREWIVRSVLGSYWGGHLKPEQVLAALDESVVWGAYEDTTQIGFIRAVTDGAVFSSITDVFVSESHRGKGVGSALMDAVIADSRIKNTICILQARPAAQLWYRHWAFRVIDPVHGICQRMPT